MNPSFSYFRSGVLFVATSCALLTPLAQAQFATQPLSPFSPLTPLAAIPKLETRLSSSGNPSGVLALDNIIVVVNNEVITKNDLNVRISSVVQQLQKQGTALPPQDELSKQILEREINTMVQLQEARESSIRVDNDTLDKTLQRIADENNLSMTDFRGTMERDGVKWSKFREEIRTELIMARLREREVENSINVAEAEVDTQLAVQAREATADVEYRLAHILVQVPEQATAAQIELRRKRALQALSELRKGSEFAQISAQFSDAPDALQGGDLGWRESGRLPTIFIDAINTLTAGESTDILRSANGFHIVKLLDKRGRSAVPSIMQTHARHILIRNKEGVNDEDAKQRLLRLRERVTTGADFAELAKVHSDDGSAAKGGDLGWITPGDTVPEFERAMNTLRDNEISQPVQSQFGWHLIQVLEHRSEGLSEDRRRQAARAALKQRKSDEAYQDWVRQIRDRAFVEYRADAR